jgi:hypothetical protein
MLIFGAADVSSAATIVGAALVLVLGAFVVLVWIHARIQGDNYRDDPNVSKRRHEWVRRSLLLAASLLVLTAGLALASKWLKLPAALPGLGGSIYFGKAMNDCAKRHRGAVDAARGSDTKMHAVLIVRGRQQVPKGEVGGSDIITEFRRQLVRRYSDHRRAELKANKARRLLNSEKFADAAELIHDVALEEDLHEWLVSTEANLKVSHPRVYQEIVADNRLALTVDVTDQRPLPRRRWFGLGRSESG